MYRVLAYKDNSVSQGVLDKTFEAKPDLVEVTYVDHNNTPHTVYAHKDGPFKGQDAIVQAHQNGTLHPEREPQPEPEEPRPPQGFAFD